MINSSEDLQLKGRVQAIFISRQKGLPRDKTRSGRFLEDHGLEGDIHAGPGKRQVPLYGSAGHERLAAGDSDGLCFRRFQETLCLDGIDTRLLKSGERLEAGGVVFEISEARKKCYPECPIIKRGRRCDLADSVRFCRVISGGILSVGDLVQVSPIG
jgi:cyclic pyranopterin monophosphate synthase